MPLLKLWNTLLGRSAKIDAAPASQVEAQQAAATAVPPVSLPSATQPSTGVAPVAPARKPVLSLFSAGPHAALCKQLQSIRVDSVLELCVEDGSRAIAMLQTLGVHQPEIRYFAIDQFEMAGGPITLKQFHQKLRAENIRPQVFPETIDRGLTRFSHTVGAIDLIVIGTPPAQWQTSSTLTLLARISHPATMLIYRDGEQWRTYQLVGAQLRRAA